MDDLQTVVTALLDKLTQCELADLVPCSKGLISMLHTGKRGTRTSYAIERRLRELHAGRCPQTNPLAGRTSNAHAV